MEDNSTHPIDELFRSKLNEDQPAYEDSLWEEVEQVMDQRKKKRRFLILMFSLLILVSGGTGYFLLPGKATQHDYVAANPQKQVTSQNSVGNEVTSANSMQGSISKKEEMVSASNQASSNVSTQFNNSINANENLNTTSSINNSTGKAFSSANARTSMPASKRHKTSNSIAQASTVAAIQTGSGGNSLPDKTTVAATKPDSANNNQGIGATTINANSFLRLKGNPTSSKDELVDTSTKKEVAQSDDQSKLKKPAHKSVMKWYVEVDGAYMYNAHIVGAPTSISSNYDNIRGSDERPLGTFNYMFKVGVVRKNIQFNTGLGITNVGERVAYKNHNDTTGNPIIHSSTVFERNGSYVNEYVTVPLQVALLIPVKGVRFQLGGGVAASTPVRWNSYYLNKQIDGLEDPGSLKMVNNFVFNFNFTFGIEVPFTRHLVGLASFEFYRDLSNVFKSDYGVKQEYLGPGGSLGIRYSFAR